MAKKILVLSSYRFWPVRDGGHQRIWNLFSNLNDNFQVTFLTTEWSGKNHYLKYRNNSYLSVSPNSKLINAARSHVAKFGHFSWDMASLIYCTRFPHLGNIIRRSNPDIVVLVRIWLFPLRVFFPDKFVVLDCHDIESNFGKTKKMSKTISTFVYNYEKYVVRNVDLVIACTEKDAEGLRKMGARNVTVVPNGFNESKQKFQNLQHSGNKFVFVGSGHAPNVDAVQRIIQIAAKIPEIEFIIIGSVSNHPELKTKLKNIHWKGFLTDSELTKELCEARGFINPMTSGSGSSLKIAQACAYGLPIIGSRFGVRGYEDLLQDCFYEAETDLDYELALKQICSDDFNDVARQNSLIERVQELNWNKLVAKVESILENSEITESKFTDTFLVDGLNEITKIDLVNFERTAVFKIIRILKNIFSKLPLPMKYKIRNYLLKFKFKEYAKKFFRISNFLIMPIHETKFHRRLMSLTNVIKLN